MKLVPTRNMEAYIRKMAIDGYIIQVDLADIVSVSLHVHLQKDKKIARAHYHGKQEISYFL